MSKHAEIIFETGSKSVLAYDDEAEVRAFVQEHTDRAKNGKPGSAQDWAHRLDLHDTEPEVIGMASSTASRPAERISKVLLYDKHPADHGSDELLTLDQVNSLVAALSDNGMINIHELTSALRREVNPVVSGEIGPHDSMYKMDHVSELDLSFLNGGESN